MTINLVDSMTKVERILNPQIETGNELLGKTKNIPDGDQHRYDPTRFNYPENVVRSFSRDAESWEIETRQLLCSLFGPASPQVIDFQDRHQDKSRFTNFRDDLCDELAGCLAYLSALVKSNQIDAHGSALTVDDSEFKTPKVFISHSSKDDTLVRAFIHKILIVG